MQPRRIALALSLIALSACGSSNDTPPDAVTACSDGADNDDDGLSDFPADPGCADPSDNDESNVPIAQCADGRDNDADGLIDYPNDPGCVSPLQNNEMDGCPTDCPACANGTDDDEDTLTDYPDDTGCTSAADDDEYVTNPAACGSGIIVERLLSDEVTGMLVAGGPSVLTGSCGGAGDESAYEIVVHDPTVIVASTDDTTTTANTVLYLLSNCMDPTSELACADDIDTNNHKSTITASVAPGTYYLIVDNHDLAVAGNFKLHVDLFAGEGVECTTTDECGPGLICRIPSGMTQMVCAQPVCNDGLDDDSDGTPDYPADPGCSGPADPDETDDCPDGPSCPACANGLDDDGDTMIDYPLDTDCAAASQPVEGCSTESDPLLVMTSGTETGDLTGSTNDYTLSCGLGGGADKSYVVALPAMKSVQFDTNMTTIFDTTLGFYASDCTSELACDDDGGTGVSSLLTMTNLPAGTYVLVMAAYNAGLGGPYTITTTGVIASGGQCDGALAAAGVIHCDTDYTCTGGFCVGSHQCNNGVDDDLDGHAGFPDDPGCTSETDDDETDDCPDGPTCPSCSNGLDDDGDLDADYPADTGCSSASDFELCSAESDPIVAITAQTTSGTTVGATGDFIATCQTSTTAADVSYLLTLPVGVTTLTADTNTSGWDTVLTIDTPECETPLLGCDDDTGTPGNESSLTLTNLAAGDYIITVDGYAGGSMPFQLHVNGVAVAGADCSSPLFAANVLTCAAGQTCTAGTCQ